MRTVLKHYFVPHADNEYAPHFFRDTCLTFFAIITIALLSLSVAGSFAAKETGLLGAIYSSVLVDLANQNREETNLKTLTINPVLERAASLKVDDMIQKGYFAHQSPDGITPWYWLSKAGYSFIYAGENLAIHFTESEAVNQAWMASPGHRANILNKNFSEIGIAVRDGFYNGRNTTFVVQMFGKPTYLSEKHTPKTLSYEDNTVPNVKGESIEILEQTQNDTQTESFIFAKNTALEQNIELVGEMTAPQEKKTYSSWFERLVMRFPKIIENMYITLGTLVALAILVLVSIEIKHQHPKNLAYGLLILVLIGGSLYVHNTTELAQLARLL